MNYTAEIKKCDESTITQWANKEIKEIKNPWLCYIGLTNICNNRCLVCPHKSVMRSNKGVMSFALFKKIVDNLPKEIKKIYLMKQGEPFLNMELENYAKYLRQQKPDVHVSVHTNGVVARKERVEKILPEIDSLGISISAITPETYKQVHGTDNFEKVTKNLKDISGILSDYSYDVDKKPHVFIDYVHQNANSHEDEQEVVDFFKSNFPDLSSIDFHWVYNFQGEIEEGNMEIYNKLDYDKFPCCVFPWSAITFCYDGKVSYCFVEPRENRFLGDMTEQSFDEIWNGNEYQIFRKMMVQKKFNELFQDGFFCNKCSWLWSMHSQSPRNLCFGYSTFLNENQPKYAFGDMLEIPQEKLFRYGIDYYLQGEILQALSCFQFTAITGCEENLVDASNIMSDKCKSVLKKYNNLHIWQKLMQAEGITPKNKQCRYYRLK